MTLKKFTPFIILLLVSMLPIIQVPRASSVESSAQDQALALIENVFPIDLSQYNITLTQSNNMSVWTISAQEILTYTLESEESVFDINFNFENNIFTFCFVGIQKGSILSDRTYASLTEAAKVFLDKYQKYKGENLATMKRMLNYADETKNMTLISGNLTLTIKSLNTEFGDSTSFSWVYKINGADYTKLAINFRNGVFDGLYDNRDLYKIGSTAVNISKEQAVRIAMDYVKNNYSYDMGGGVTISDFNVTEDRAVAWLGTSPREPYVLYPIWKVMLYLDKRYPGSVIGLLLGLWADSGEVLFCGNQAYATPYPDEPIIVDPYYGQDEPIDIVIEIPDEPLEETNDPSSSDLTPPDENPPADSTEQTGLDLTTDQKGLDLTSILIAIPIVSAIILGIIVFRKTRMNKRTTPQNNH